MKINRLKKAQKNIDFYVNNYKFRKPYQILLDGTFSFAAIQNKFNIQEQLTKYFLTEIKLLTTQCVISETEKLGAKLYAAMLIIKQFGVHKCGHEKNSLSGSKCLESMIGSNNLCRYVIATQDRLLQEHLRKIPGVPIMYLHGKTPTLESPSRISREFAHNLSNHVITDIQEKAIKILKKQSSLETNAIIKQKKKHKMGGPNPLSCKKSKNKQNTTNLNKKTNEVNKRGKIRKRKWLKLPVHIKEDLKLNS